MQQDFSRYLAKRADLDRWPLHVDGVDGVDAVVVIPCLAEREQLPKTLASLAACDSEQLRHALIICVVNNRAPEHAVEKDIQDNQALLRDLHALVGGRDTAFVPRDVASSLRLAFIDASSSGNELPKKDGVGLARKIGLDWGISVLAESAASVRLLCSLDADTAVAPNYLDAVYKAFDHERAWAGVVYFEHPLPDEPMHRQAIVDYEIFLRCHVHGLRDAGSPYAFHTVGSTMVCTPEAYVAVSGMNRRQGAEDFYFLQQLAKTGEIQSIVTTTVYPSARPSHRVPFGTGRSVRQTLDNTGEKANVYNPKTYGFVRRCLGIATIDCQDSQEVLEHPTLRAEPLQKFLRDQGFESAWPRIQKGAMTEQQRVRQFHTWFDAFRTLKLIHFLRDNGFPNVGIDAAARVWTPTEVLGYEPEGFLMWLREQDREAASGTANLLSGTIP